HLPHLPPFPTRRSSDLAVRLAHYQHASGIYDRLDTYGIVAWSEIPLDANFNTSSDFTSNIRQQLIETIRQNFNHPSVIMWGIAKDRKSTRLNSSHVKIS